jgi:transposase-like protein
MSNGKRRQFSGQQKVEIVKRHLVDGIPVSQLCEEYKIHPTQFYQWQKQLFENGEKAFERQSKGPDRSKALEQRRIAKLEAKIVQKNEVVAELLEEHVKLKKELGEL